MRYDLLHAVADAMRAAPEIPGAALVVRRVGQLSALPSRYCCQATFQSP